MKKFKVINHEASVFDLIKKGACRNGIEQLMTHCKCINTNFAVTDPIPFTQLDWKDLNNIDDCLDFLEREKIIEEKEKEFFPYGTIVRGRYDDPHRPEDFQDFLIIKSWETKGGVYAQAVIIGFENVHSSSVGFTYGDSIKIDPKEKGISREILDSLIHNYKYTETLGTIKDFIIEEDN